MKILITYSTQSGNTEKLARAIYDHMEGDKSICPVKEAPAPSGYDLVAVGFWLMAGKPDPKSAEYLAACGPDTRLFLFATHGAGKASDHAKAGMANAAALTDGAQIQGAFNCQGEVNPTVLEKVRQKETPPPWIYDADTAVGHPDASDINALQAVLDKL
jgi:flavodoxin